MLRYIVLITNSSLLFRLAMAILWSVSGQKRRYRKVTSSRPVYYSIFDYFWGATNWDVLLTETCYYCLLQELINYKGIKYLAIINFNLCNILIYHSLWPIIAIFITKWSEIFWWSTFINDMSNRNSWGSYICGKIRWLWNYFLFQPIKLEKFHTCCY